MDRPGNIVCHGNTFVHVCLWLLGLVVCTCAAVSSSASTKGFEPRGTPMHKAQLTQKGYIQFLRWQLPVPEITEFTFCLWIQSEDLTHPHSIFSYSRNERERLVRSWISSGGKSVHLEIGGRQVVASTTDIREGRWYHVCLSWENQLGLYGLWINGQLWARGYSQETVGHRIPSGGDIVLGQEYTDFDKGLEEGIEGSVLGFNLLLASAFDPLARGYRRDATYDQFRAPSEVVPAGPSYASAPLVAGVPKQPAAQRGVDHETRTFRIFYPTSNQSRGRRYAENVRSLSLLATNRNASDTHIAATRQISRGTVQSLLQEPIGLQLVKLSYVRCEIGRGSPFIGGPLMLISWSRTPVRVFGGAILRNVKSECGNF